MAKVEPMERWSCAKSAELYGVGEWGSGHFSVADNGELNINLGANGHQKAASLWEIVQDVRARGLDLPVLLRFGDLLDSRITLLNDEFAKAMKTAGYNGRYRGVYPIKVNQQQQVVEEICGFGARYHHGLEAGSKAELIAAMAYIADPEALLVCNGYKDEEFIDLALYARKIGIQTVLVVEMPGEVNAILERSRALGIEPVIGVRMRLSTRAGGHWNESGGDRSVFGLNTAQVMDVVDRLRDAEMLHTLRMLHYHLGSQLPNIRDIRRGISEAIRFYAGLVREGAAMGLLNVGGGLAVDYDGSKTNFSSSRNYSLEEYCADIVEGVMAVCDEHDIPHPDIVSESGRATVAYYSVLLFNVLDVNRFCSHELPQSLGDDTHDLLRDMMEVKQSLTSKNAQECLHDLLYYRDEVLSRFLHGAISLRQRALAEQIFWATVTGIADIARDLKYVPEELSRLDHFLSDIYYGNFSVFQSLPDSWAIQQLFPIMPVHRLNEAPTRQAILADITCDCDGKIDRFIDLHDVRHSLPLHELTDEGDYVLGVFLVGAYQETLGDLHNLLGDTNVVSIRVGTDGALEFTHEIAGDAVSDVLSYVEYDPKQLLENVRRRAERIVRSGDLTPKDRREILDAYQAGLRGYTYYES